MVASPRKKRSLNAFERATENSLYIETSWRQLMANALSAEKYANWHSNTTIGLDSEVQSILLLGGSLLCQRSIDRHTILVRDKETLNIVRKISVDRQAGMLTPSSMTLDQLECYTEHIVTEALDEQSIEQQAEVKRVFSPASLQRLARMVLGEDASDEDVSNQVRKMWPPDEVFGSPGDLEEVVLPVTLDEHDCVVVQSTDTEKSFLHYSEWDFTSPKEINALGGPESDFVYAFRLRRLCAAIRETSGDVDASYSLLIQLGSLAKEWEHWRQYDELLKAGLEIRAKKLMYAKNKTERPWMRQVREDFENGLISDATEYAGKINRRISLKAPSVRRIQNYISELRQEKARQTSVTPSKET